jgi:hypothetical protein
MPGLRLRQCRAQSVRVHRIGEIEATLVAGHRPHRAERSPMYAEVSE